MKIKYLLLFLTMALLGILLVSCDTDASDGDSDGTPTGEPSRRPRLP